MCGGGLEHRHNIIRINITAAAGQDQEAGPGLGGKLQPTLPLLSLARCQHQHILVVESGVCTGLTAS